MVNLIAISGKASSGKNTLAKLLFQEIEKYSYAHCYNLAFSDPIKNIVRIMFPDLQEEFLTGPSEYRSKTIPGAFKNGQPLTVRQLLTDLGTGVGRGYKDNIWLDTFDNSLKKSLRLIEELSKLATSVIFVEDVRFRNEFDHVKNLNFFTIRLLREFNSTTSISKNQSLHISETQQDSISDEEFDYVLHNNGTLEDFKKEVAKIVQVLGLNKLTS